MGSPIDKRIYTRRDVLVRAVRFGTSAAAVVAFGSPSTSSAFAQSQANEGGVEVLHSDLIESTPAAFARGERRGVEVTSDGEWTTLRGRGGEFVSGLLELPFPATHLGLHWKMHSVSPRSLAVSVRTSGDGLAWDDWRDVSIEAIADLSGGTGTADDAVPVHGHGHDIASDGPARREVFASLVHGNRAAFTQYRVTFPTSEDASLEAMTITAINSVDGPRTAVGTTATTSKSFICPDGKAFTVITREGWGCDESLRFKRIKGKTAEIWPEMYVPSKKVVLHHTATSNMYVDGSAEVRAIYNYHARTLGWGDIGYHVLVDRFGNIYEGRHGRGEDAATREIMSSDVVAGHVYGHNYGSTGIAAIGDFDTTAELSSEMMTAIEDLMTVECGRQFIDPVPSSAFLQSDGVWHSMLANISGHRDSYNTACPGANLYPKLGELRQSVASRLGSAATPQIGGATTEQSTLKEPATLSAEWSSSDSSYEICLEGWYKASGSENITYLQGYEASGYNDPLAMEQAWVTTGATSAEWSDLPAGHYTVHLRTSNGVYEANRTWLVEGSSGGNKPGKPQR